MPVRNLEKPSFCSVIVASRTARMFDPNLLPHLDAPVSFTLDSGVELHHEAPDTFYLPSEDERTSLRSGDYAKLIFRMTDGEKVAVERMWVMVEEVKAGGYAGVLRNQPYCTGALAIGLRVESHADQVIQIRKMP